MVEKQDGEVSHADNQPSLERCKSNGGNGWQCHERRSRDHLLFKRYFSPRKYIKKNRTLSVNSALAEEGNRVDNAFVKGQEVEVSIQEVGFEDSWFIATVVHQLKKKNDDQKYLVQYRTLLGKDGLNPLREYVLVCNLRPHQPIGISRVFELDELVDAFANDGWWKGVVTKVIGDSRYSVFFRLTNDEFEYEQSELRPHMEWLDGKWVLASQPQEAGTIVQNDARFPSPNPTESYAPTTDVDASQTPVRVRNIVCDPKSTQVIGSSQKIIEEAEEPLSLPTTQDPENDLEDEDIELIDSPKSQVQFQKGKSLLVTEIEQEALEGVDSPMENVTESKSIQSGHNNARLPFIKSSKMWEELESQEVFKLIPQNPHFHPLEKENEEVREEIALGYMSSFPSLWERTSNASLEDPRSVFEARLAMLTELEDLGFNIQPLRSRLEEILKIKDSYTPQVDKFNTIEREVLDEKREFDDTRECLSLLNKHLQQRMKEKENKIADLERMADEVKESIEGVTRDFQKVVSASW